MGGKSAGLLEAEDLGRKKKFVQPDVAPVSAKRIAVQGSPEWVAWLERAARFAKINDVSKFVDMSTAHYARTIGFPEGPPDRIP
jgi:hypothetical protein